MNIKSIKNEGDYEEALGAVEPLVALDPDPESEEGKKLIALSALIESYENEHYPSEYEYISFELKEHKPKTDVWICVNKKSNTALGRVLWYGPWRQYVFLPEKATIFSTGCMADISDFINKKMGERRRGDGIQICNQE